MDSGHFTRSQARKTSLVSDIPSDVEPDDVAPETVSSGPVRLPVTAAEKLESIPQKLAVPPSAPMEGVDGGIGSESSLFAGVPLSAPGGQIDPQFGPTSFMPIVTELMPNQAAHKYEPKLPLSDSGVPGGSLPDAAAVGERPMSSAARRRRGHRRRLQTLHKNTRFLIKSNRKSHALYRMMTLTKRPKLSQFVHFAPVLISS